MKYAIIPYPKIGDSIKADGGFTCLKENDIRVVCEDELGLYVKCSEGNHYLDGQQCDDNPNKIIGFFPAR